MNPTNKTLPALAASAMLGVMNISVWTARKKDRATELEVQEDKGAKSRKAASVYKNLFSECTQLEQIVAFAAESRVWFNKVTLPWNDNGGRLIPTSAFFDINTEAGTRQEKFRALVNAFIKVYKTEVSKQAFVMGALFDRNEYPEPEVVAQKFNFGVSFEPLPMAGDFRVDVGTDQLQELQQQYEVMANQRVSAAMEDAFSRLKEHALKVQERMTAVLDFKPDATEEVTEKDEQGNPTKVEIKTKRRPKVYESLIDNGLELCGIMEQLNVLRDPKLDEIRRTLQQSLMHTDIKSLRESEDAQKSLKKKMDDLLDKFDF